MSKYFKVHKLKLILNQCKHFYLHAHFYLKNDINQSKGLKETESVTFDNVMKDFILEHYSEDGEYYNDEIADFNDLRDATMTPCRDEDGIDLLYEYYNQLYFIDNRFFPPSRPLGVFLSWYDSLTGLVYRVQIFY